MSTDTKQLIDTYEQLPEAERIEVSDFARFLLARKQEATTQREQAERWLAGARGVARPDVITDQVMTLTRGEP
jgi:hypothetical protein